MPRRSPLSLAALATAAVPGLDVVSTRSPQYTTPDVQVTGVLDSGGRHWVVHCPLHAAAGAALEAEVALLANLAPQVTSGSLPFAVPQPAGFASLPEGGRAMVYRQLPGRPLDLSRLRPGPGLVADLGRCLAALHELSPRIVEDAGLPSYDTDEYRKRRLAEVDAAARTGHVPPVVLARWEHALEDVALWRFRTTPVHADLTEDHVFVLDGEVSAVIGFTEAHVGDPAVDLAWLLSSAPEECVDSILEAYALGRPENADQHLADRALLVSELALARWLMHGVNTGSEEIVADATRMLADLAEQVEASEPIGHREPVVVPGRAEDWQHPDDPPEPEVAAPEPSAVSSEHDAEASEPTTEPPQPEGVPEPVESESGARAEPIEPEAATEPAAETASPSDAATEPAAETASPSDAATEPIPRVDSPS